MERGHCKSCGYEFEGDCEYWGCFVGEVKWCQEHRNTQPKGGYHEIPKVAR